MSGRVRPHCETPCTKQQLLLEELSLVVRVLLPSLLNQIVRELRLHELDVEYVELPHDPLRPLTASGETTGEEAEAESQVSDGVACVDCAVFSGHDHITQCQH